MSFLDNWSLKKCPFTQALTLWVIAFACIAAAPAQARCSSYLARGLLALSRPDFRQEHIWEAREHGQTDKADRLQLKLEKYLRTGSIVWAGSHPLSSRVTVLTFANGIRGIFKSLEQSERWKWSWQDGYIYFGKPNVECEVFAYRADRLMGVDIVPTTVFRTYRGFPGVVSYYVENDFKESIEIEAAKTKFSPHEIHRTRLAAAKGFRKLIFLETALDAIDRTFNVIVNDRNQVSAHDFEFSLGFGNRSVLPGPGMGHFRKYVTDLLDQPVHYDWTGKYILDMLRSLQVSRSFLERLESFSPEQIAAHFEGLSPILIERFQQNLSEILSGYRRAEAMGLGESLFQEASN